MSIKTSALTEENIWTLNQIHKGSEEDLQTIQRAMQDITQKSFRQYFSITVGSFSSAFGNLSDQAVQQIKKKVTTQLRSQIKEACKTATLCFMAEFSFRYLTEQERLLCVEKRPKTSIEIEDSTFDEVQDRALDFFSHAYPAFGFASQDPQSSTAPFFPSPLTEVIQNLEEPSELLHPENTLFTWLTSYEDIPLSKNQISKIKQHKELFLERCRELPPIELFCLGSIPSLTFRHRELLLLLHEIDTIPARSRKTPRKTL